MKHTCILFTTLAVSIHLSLAAGLSSAAILSESGTLGPTGVSYSELTSGAVPSTSVDMFVYAGVRLHLDKPVITSQIGGHFVSFSSGTFFGAVVELDDENDFPDSFDFSTSDLLGTTTLEFPNPSDEVFGNLTLALEPGWYALVFGSGLFGTNGDGAAVRNGSDLGEITYIAAQPFSGISEWIDVSSELPNHRFVITGTIVPEPSSIILVVCTSILPFIRRI